MTDETRKLLTEYLGERWHEVVGHMPCLFTCSCNTNFRSSTILKHIALANRTFTDPRDADALRRKMVEKGEWRTFYEQITCDFTKEGISMAHFHADYTNWLMKNMNELAGEWRKEMEKS